MQTLTHTEGNRTQRRAKPVQASKARNIDAAAGLRALHNSRPYEPGEMMVEHIITREAYDNLRSGKGTSADFDRISMSLNIGLVRAESIDAILIEVMQRAQDAMFRMKDRVLRGLPFGFDASGLADLPVALDAYEAILDGSSPQQMMTAMQVVWHRIFNKDCYETA